ncbi:NUDIX hydrolase [Porticoccus sp. GXU_MW_L64]
MNYCSNCGQPVKRRIPEGDDHERDVCDHCDTIHYQNPLIITGCLPIYDDGNEQRVLLCKRAIEPQADKWTIPAGFMENGETTEQGAARECLEESRAEVEIGQLYTMTSIPGINQVHLFFLANLPKPEFRATPESLEVKLFREDEIPWGEIAFTSVKATLDKYFKDRARGVFPLHSGWTGPSQRGEWHWHKS